MGEPGVICYVHSICREIATLIEGYKIPNNSCKVIESEKCQIRLRSSSGLLGRSQFTRMGQQVKDGKADN